MKGLSRALLGILCIPLLGVLFGSSYASAASVYDDWLRTSTVLEVQNANRNVEGRDDGKVEIPNLNSFLSDRDNWFSEENGGPTEAGFASLIKAVNEGDYIVWMEKSYPETEYASTTVHIAWTETKDMRAVFQIEPNYPAYSNVVIDRLNNAKRGYFQITVDDDGGWFSTDRALVGGTGENNAWANSFIGGSPNGEYNNSNHYYEIWESSISNFETPEGYAGINLGDFSNIPESTWTPDIKLHRGTNWEVELSDYNFFSFDALPFTCGPDEMDPVINWEVWDITDNDNRVLIDTMINGASSVVTYNAPKIQEDKKYELVAWYSDCEGYTFSEASTRQFTVKKDGNLKSTDLAAVCIMEEFPYINIPNCIGDINDLFVTLSFRTPKAGDVGGGGFLTLVNGCRELQVLDDWMMSPNTTVCPKMPAEVRSTITPFIVFGLALLAVGLISRRAGGSTV